MSNEMEEIKQRYAFEISEINYRLRLLEEGRITENTRANGDGYLATNIINLRKELNRLFSKVINESDSVNDELNDLFK